METIPIATLSSPEWVLHWDGRDESDFSVSFIVRGKVTRQCPQNHNVLRAWEENRSRIEPRPFSLPLGQTGSRHGHFVPSIYMSVSTDHKILTAWEERRAEAESNRGPSAYHPTAQVNCLTPKASRLTKVWPAFMELNVWETSYGLIKSSIKPWNLQTVSDQFSFNVAARLQRP